MTRAARQQLLGPAHWLLRPWLDLLGGLRNKLWLPSVSLTWDKEGRMNAMILITLIKYFICPERCKFELRGEVPRIK